jgi:outer membrane protein assembly factor BamB
VKWVYSTGATAMMPPSIGSVYAVSNDRLLHAMNGGPGGGDWPAGWIPFAMNGPAQSRPPVVPVSIGGSNKVVFLGSWDGHAYAVDADNGSEIWMSPSLGQRVLAAPAGIFSKFGAAFDLVLVGSRNSSADNAFYGLHLNDGSIAWAFINSVAQLGDGSGIGIINGDATVDYANSRLYFASYERLGGSDNTVWCLDITGTGATLKWAQKLGNIDGSPILYNSRIYVGTTTSQVYALNAETGDVIWSFDCADGPVKGFITPDLRSTKLYFSTTNKVWSLSDDGASATKIWDETSISAPSIPLFTQAGNYLLVGSSDGSLYQLDVSTPIPTVSSIVLGDGSAGIGSPSLDVRSNLVHVGTESGEVHAVLVPL